MARRERRRLSRPETPIIDTAPIVNPEEPRVPPPVTIAAAKAGDVAFLPAAPLPVTKATPFRASGDVPFETWSQVAKAGGCRYDDDTLRQLHNAASGNSAQFLERWRVESGFGTSRLPAPNNIFGLRNRNGGLDFEAFASPVDCLSELRRRWTTSAYKSGVYMPQNLSIEAMLTKYSPPSENDTAALIRATVDHVNTWRGGVPDAEKPEYTFGHPKWPNGLDVRTLDLAPNGQGWDALGDRSAIMALTVCHHTAGRDNRDSVYALFSRGGGRWGQAATDIVIDRTGRGYVMLDPWSLNPDDGSGITPWASGPASSLKGIGVQIVQQLGANAVNKRGLSCEHCNVDGQGFTDAQVDLSAKAYAVGITRMKIPWDAFPTNPALGLRVDAVHNRFAPTECPGADWPWGGAFHTAWVQAVQHEAKVLQTGSAPSSPSPVPEPSPSPDPAFYTAYGLPRAMMDRLFGTMTRYDPATNKATDLPFNPEGVLSQLWLQRFGPKGLFPEAEEMVAFDSKLAPGLEWFATWEGGYTAWLPIDNNRASWKWLDETEPVQ